jgi:hypothetical protein
MRSIRCNSDRSRARARQSHKASLPDETFIGQARPLSKLTPAAVPAAARAARHPTGPTGCLRAGRTLDGPVRPARRRRGFRAALAAGTDRPRRDHRRTAAPAAARGSRRLSTAVHPGSAPHPACLAAHLDPNHRVASPRARDDHHRADPSAADHLAGRRAAGAVAAQKAPSHLAFSSPAHRDRSHLGPSVDRRESHRVLKIDPAHDAPDHPAVPSPAPG